MALVRFFTNEYGEEEDDKSWHFTHSMQDATRALCSGQVFGFGESAVKYETKDYKKGSLTCKNCREMLKYFKSIPL